MKFDNIQVTRLEKRASNFKNRYVTRMYIRNVMYLAFMHSPNMDLTTTC